MEPMKSLESAERWWPTRLGEPSCSGSRDGLGYAFFPRLNRLLLNRGGTVTSYDSGPHRIVGMLQDAANIRLISQAGEIGLRDLRKLSRETYHAGSNRFSPEYR
jgi:hypothetical protein